MFRNLTKPVTALLLSFLIIIAIKAEEFTLVNNAIKVSIVYDVTAPALDSIAGHLLAQDIERVTGYLPVVFTDLSKASGHVIILGHLSSPVVARVLKNNPGFISRLKGKWECYGLTLIKNPTPNIKKALVITGSDRRGTAYGTFHIAEMIGVSPWYWWADVQPKRQTVLSLDINTFVSNPPSIKYRGIFINDEDWGLQPWAAKTFEPETGDIGPKTYARVFELLLRLKANLIWPAMHPSTKAFYSYPGNKKTAGDYGIIIGSSHAEPMLRNNVGEWDVKTMGAFNYITNKQKVYDYWQARIKESAANDAAYSLGMRGVHDSGIEGVRSVKEAIPLLENIFEDQRNMLTEFVNKDIKAIPQVFTAYKEVLDIYEAGLKIPDDVTLVWPDDNYGYIQRLNNEKEKQRPGGSGVYYHASYWGRPHDYLWLSSTHPALIREEMMKAYETKADRYWVLNVGDIKPLEYNIQLFLDMAYDATPFKDSRYTREHLRQWVGNIFGKDKAERISSILLEYYQLAFERRPEFMGWSQTEPTTKTTLTEYNHFAYGDEAQRRIERYNALELQVKHLQSLVEPAAADAFFQLVYYPVVGAAWMNRKFLFNDKSYWYGKQHRQSALDYASLAKQAYDSIETLTAIYNNRLANGKWQHIMSMKPRDLPAYQPPTPQEISINKNVGWSICPEGMSAVYDSSVTNLPLFNRSLDNKYFIDIFLSDEKSVSWTTSTPEGWIILSKRTGELLPVNGKNQLRLWVSIDWKKIPASDTVHGTITFSGGGKTYNVAVTAVPGADNQLRSFKGCLENNGYVSIHAANFNRSSVQKDKKWIVIEGLGHTGKLIQALPLNRKDTGAIPSPEAIRLNAARVEYDFFTFTPAAADVQVITLPSHPVNQHFSMRYAVSIDEGPLQVLDFKTVGRSEEWKRNVLSNAAKSNFKSAFLAPGKHTLNIYVVDPGVMIDRIMINMGGMKKAYSVVPETRINR